MSNQINLFLLISLTFTLISCQFILSDDTAKTQDANRLTVSHDSDIKVDSTEIPFSRDSINRVAPERMYNIENIDDIIVLPPELIEISGLSFDPENGRLLANNDEEGVIYHLNLDGTIAGTEKFGKDGDYEGIERIGEEIVVSKQNGNLYFYDPYTQGTTKVKTDLSSKNDIEGLAYDPDHELILMACKGQTLDEDNKKKEKVIYAYNLKLGVLHQEPYLVMGDPEHLSFVEYHIHDVSQYKKKAFHKRAKGFSPSGVAINPLNKDLYIISARGSIVIIYDQNHDLKDIMFLDEDVIPQPEGICFSPQGDLFISTEGKGLSAKIFKFQKI